MRYAGERAYTGEGDIPSAIKLGVILGLIVGVALFGQVFVS